MAIYRGIGGAGDSNTDATITAVTEQATDAAQSATEAAASATSAASSAASASSSATTASTAATNASGSAATASTAAASAAATVDTVQTAAANAASSEANAAASESASAASETAAAASETASAASASSASTSASAASTSASAASTSASAASTSATNAATSATNAATSETNAASSASAASTSATAADSSASEAATSASNAATSESNASDSETAAATSETNASGSATAAASSATAAASSATSASTSATTATTKASEAATSATNAATSETNAAASASAAASSASSASASADAALAALDSFDDRYLGQKASDPTLDNDGNALVAGALYFNTTDDVMKVYEGSTWVAAYASLSGALLANNNLSDLLNATEARTNLGLGTAATTASTAYATAAQGALADTALQSFTETDPVFSASEAASITSTDTTNWDTAYGWGNHAGLYVTPTYTGNVNVTGTVTADGLTVDGNIVANGGGTADPEFRLSGASGGVTRDYAMGTDSLQRLYWYDWTASAYRMVIDSSGNVGIGTSNPSATLDVNGTANFGDGNSRLNIEFSSGNARINNKDNSSLILSTSNTERMRIDASGNVGIGTSSPNNPLEVNANNPSPVRISRTDLDANVSLQFHQATSDWYVGASSDGKFSIDTDNNLLTSPKMAIDSSGNVGIGTSSPAHKLDVNGTIGATTVDLGDWTVTESAGVLYFATGGVNKMKLDASGNLTVVGDVTAYGTI